MFVEVGINVLVGAGVVTTVWTVAGGVIGVGDDVSTVGTVADGVIGVGEGAGVSVGACARTSKYPPTLNEKATEVNTIIDVNREILFFIFSYNIKVIQPASLPARRLRIPLR